MLRFLLPTSQTCLAPNQVVAHCVGTNFWLDNIRRESRCTRELRHLLQNKFALGWKNAQHVQIFSFSTFYYKFSRPATTWFVARQVWKWLVGHTFVQQQRCKTSCTFLLPVLPYLSVSRLRHRYALTEKAWEDAIHRLGNKMATAASYCANCHWDVSWESCNVDNWEQRHGPCEDTKLFTSSCSVRHVNHLLAFFIRCSFWSSYISSLLLNFYEVLNIVSV